MLFADPGRFTASRRAPSPIARRAVDGAARLLQDRDFQGGLQGGLRHPGVGACRLGLADRHHPRGIDDGVIAVLALIANGSVAVLFYRHRQGDANMRSVWICSSNDAIGNVAVGLAALGVFGTGRAWPDLLVAVFMAALALTGAASVLRQARWELRLLPIAAREQGQIDGSP